MPQNLTRASITPSVVTPVSARTAASGSRRGRELDADEHRVGAGARDALDVRPRRHAALRDRDDSARNQRQQSLATSPGSISSVSRLRLLMPIDRRAELERELELVLVAHLDEHLERQSRAAVDQLPEPGRRNGARDEQRRRRAERFRLEELDRLDVKILLEQRNADGVARAREVVVRAAEVSRAP